MEIILVLHKWHKISNVKFIETLYIFVIAHITFIFRDHLSIICRFRFWFYVLYTFLFIVQYVHNMNTGRSANMEGAERIARHYKFMFDSVFNDKFPSASFVVVVEDDMIFSPDFISYFSQLAPIYEADPTIYCITSWNDNGFNGLVSDPRAVLRTDFMPGLGQYKHIRT